MSTYMGGISRGGPVKSLLLPITSVAAAAAPRGVGGGRFGGGYASRGGGENHHLGCTHSLVFK